MPAISVIIPVYNKIRYLRSLLEQLQAQTFADYECLLIDDGSTDGSGQVCDEFAAQDTRLRVFHISNGGVSHARNLGLDAACGRYITFIDSDDSILPEYLEHLICQIEQHGADLVISGYQKVDADGSVLCTVAPETTGTVPFSTLLPEFARVQLQTGLYGCCVAKLFPRSLVQKIRFDEKLRLAEDFEFYLKLYKIIKNISLDQHVSYLYLQEAENSTGVTADDKIDYLAQLQINLRYRSMLQKHGAWKQENKRIVEERLSDYAFFVLYHTPMPHYRERFYALHALCTAERVPLSGGNTLRKWLFFCLRNRLHHAAKFTTTLYRLARNLRR